MHWNGTPVDASADGPIDLNSQYPKADPDPTGGPTGGPDFDGGAPPGAFSCTGKTGSKGDPVLTLTSSNLLRTSLMHVPNSYDPTKGTMLILNFHGFSSDALQQIIFARMNPSADKHNFIVVYPQGVARSWNAGDCCGTAWTDSVDDVRFTKDLLAKIQKDWCIDPKRIYATGFSNGGFLSHRLACEMADVFAAVAPVSGVMGLDPNACKPARPIPVIDFHGTSDPVVPYNGGTPIIPIDLGPILKFRSVSETIEMWKKKDGCLGIGSTIYKQGDATCTQYASCSAGVEVVHCKLDGDGHTWPGGVPIPVLGATSNDISATETMVSFFKAHPMP